MASIAALSAASQDRKSRLAQLKSLKRKQEALQDDGETMAEQGDARAGEDKIEIPDTTSKYLSGRNYDPETKGAKLGFEAAPIEGKDTLEKQASILEQNIKRQTEEEEQEDTPLDLFKLQPKKPNWDLKRDMERKLELLNVRTDNAIARLVRERIAKQQAAAKEKLNGNSNLQGGGGDADAAGIEGTTLVEATNVREREAEEEARQAREEDEALLDGS